MNTPSSISRRKVTTGIAWSVPAVAAVAAAPFAAASPVICPKVSGVGGAIKFPGNSKIEGIKHAYGFDVTLTNDTSETIVISGGSTYIEFKKFGNKSGAPLLYTADPCKGGVPIESGSDLLTLEPGEKLPLFFVVTNTGNSANDSGCIYATFNVSLVGGQPVDTDYCEVIVVPKVCFNGTPPQGC